jgi:hypothetical protein
MHSMSNRQILTLAYVYKLYYSLNYLSILGDVIGKTITE